MVRPTQSEQPEPPTEDPGGGVNSKSMMTPTELMKYIVDMMAEAKVNNLGDYFLRESVIEALSGIRQEELEGAQKTSPMAFRNAIQQLLMGGFWIDVITDKKASLAHLLYEAVNGGEHEWTMKELEWVHSNFGSISEVCLNAYTVLTQKAEADEAISGPIQHRRHSERANSIPPQMNKRESLRYPNLSGTKRET